VAQVTGVGPQEGSWSYCEVCALSPPPLRRSRCTCGASGDACAREGEMGFCQHPTRGHKEISLDLGDAWGCLRATSWRSAGEGSQRAKRLVQIRLHNPTATSWAILIATGCLFRIGTRYHFYATFNNSHPPEPPLVILSSPSQPVPSWGAWLSLRRMHIVVQIVMRWECFQIFAAAPVLSLGYCG